jgi:hypothetical protein
MKILSDWTVVKYMFKSFVRYRTRYRCRYRCQYWYRTDKICLLIDFTQSALPANRIVKMRDPCIETEQIVVEFE